MNIFGNALKYTPRGTIKVSLTQERRSNQRGGKEQVVKFTAQDTGKGIGPDFLQHELFRPFSQEDTLTPGTGLGLSLVKQIVSQLRGEVSVQSQVGTGTTVSVILPLEQVPQSLEKTFLGSEDDQMFEEQVRDLKGLRIGLSLSNHNGDGNISDWQKSVPDICREWLMMEIVSNMPGTTAADILLWSHDELPSLSKDIEALAKTPNVVICPNALVAYRQSKIFEAADYAAVFEFISQPIGPRKLARALFLAYTRWMNVSDSATSSYATPVSVKRPEGPHRTQSSFTITNSSRPARGRVSSYSHSATSNPTDDDDTSIFSDVRDETLENSTPNESPTFERPNPFAKFLLVDDNHINLKVLSTYVKKLGLEYDIAMNGKEALDLFCLPHCKYTCVLMDISMPVMDGFEATRCIRAFEGREGQNHVPIIALSGLASEEAHREAIGCGMDLLLTKPVKLKALGSLLDSMGIINV
ncbi:hypothetical protein VF21_03024 [Pseudogymnoascus sp. 05NY08]|nr:hypothetical protein VF21_03024 [Pseudogymnoascus sp. 05NY08]